MFLICSLSKINFSEELLLLVHFVSQYFIYLFTFNHVVGIRYCIEEMRLACVEKYRSFISVRK